MNEVGIIPPIINIDTVIKSNIIIIFFLPIKSVSLPPIIVAGNEISANTVSIIVISLGEKPNFLFRIRISIGITKEPIAVITLPMNK
ncbi:hypothetical protein SDC9_153308 [bioreactor metagenome]|uniref:Uncharacterized protein n=1 Tax=bioreactor metagenome TaxID=1076179 RepID=A0A645F090_9ZZZZ